MHIFMFFSKAGDYGTAVLRKYSSRIRIFMIALTMLIFGGAVYLSCCLSPETLDDYAFKFENRGVPFFVAAEDSTAEINGVDFSIFASSTKNLYFHWNGRIFYHFAAYWAANVPKNIFNTVNAAVATAVLLLIMKIAAGNRPLTTGFTMSCAALFLLCCPAPGLTLFWLAGATNYLWTAMFYLIFLLPFRMALQSGENKLSAYGGILLASGAFVSGMIGCNTNENTGGAVILTVLLLSVARWRKFRKIEVWQYSGMIGGLVGYMVLIFSPGQMQRIAVEGREFPAIFKNFILQTAYWFQQMPGLAVLVLLMAGVLLRFGGKNRFRKSAVLPGIMLIGALASCYAMVFSPYSPGRAMFGAFILLLVAFGMLYFELLELPGGFLRRDELYPSVALALITGGIMLYAWRDMVFTANVHQQRKKYAIQAAERGEEEITFRSAIGVNRYNVLFKTDVLSPNDGHFVNKYLAKKLKLKKIRTLPSAAVSGMIEDILPDKQQRSGQEK